MHEQLTGNTFKRADLIEAVHREIGLSQDESVRLVESVLEEITSGLTEGSTVKITTFGSFSVRQKAGRMGRNPKTGEPAPIPPRRTVTFKPSNILKARVNYALRDQP